MPDPERQGVGDFSDRNRLAANENFTAIGRRDPVDRLRQLTPAGADQPGDAKDLAAMKREAHLAKGAAAREAAHFENSLADRMRLTREELLERPPDHELDEARLVEGLDTVGAQQGAIAEHRDAVGDGKDFVEPVADIDDGDATRFEVADDGEEPRHL